MGNSKINNPHEMNYTEPDNSAILAKYREDINLGRKTVCLDEVISNYPDFITRSDLSIPYLKICLSTGATGFVFYNTEMEVTHIMIAERFLTQEDIHALTVGESTYSDVLRMKADPFLSPISSETIEAFILQDGVAIIRCSNFTGRITSIEYISNEELGGRTLQKYGIVIPYVLPEDKYTS